MTQLSIQTWTRASYKLKLKRWLLNYKIKTNHRKNNLNNHCPRKGMSKLNRNSKNPLQKHLLLSRGSTTRGKKKKLSQNLELSNLNRGRRLCAEVILTMKGALPMCRWPRLYSTRWTKLKKMIERAILQASRPSKNCSCWMRWRVNCAAYPFKVYF